MWRSKLRAALHDPPEPLRLTHDDSGAFAGRYLWLGPGNDIELNRQVGIPCVLGNLIGEGDEALVYELIQLRNGSINEVVKICRFPPDHDKYKTWAQEVRDEVQPYSSLPNVEQVPSRLCAVEGGLVKIQSYMSAHPDTDWRTVLPAKPILKLFREGRIEAALSLTESLIQTHGAQGILLEQKSAALTMLERHEEALTALTQAAERYKSDGHYGFLLVAHNLSRALLKQYHDNFDELPGLMKITLPDGQILGQQIVSADSDDLADMHRDFADQALEAALEALALEPYYIPSLITVLEIIYNGFEAELTYRTLDAINDIDPFSAISVSHQFKLTLDPIKRTHPDDIIAQDTEIPEEVQAILERHREEYEPPVPDGVGRAETLNLSARKYAYDGQLERAERYNDEAIELAPDVPDYHATRCLIWNQTGDLDRSITYLNKQISRMADSQILYLTLGQTHSAKEEWREACIAFHKAFSCSGEQDWSVMVSLANSYRKWGRFDRAREFVSVAWLKSPSEYSLQCYLTLLRDEIMSGIQKGDSDSIERKLAEYDELRATCPIKYLNANNFIHSGQILIATGRYAEAIIDLEHSLEMEPDHEMADMTRETIEHLKAHI